MRFLILLLVLGLAAPVAHAQADSAAARAERLLRESPGEASLWFYLARARAAEGDAAATVAALERAAELADGFLPPREHFAKVWDDPGFQALRARLEAKLPRLDYAPTAFELEDRTLVPEGIAWDAASRDLFVGSIAQGRILRIDARGEGLGDIARRGLGLDPLLGLAADSPRRVLYAVATSTLTEAGRKAPRNAVLAFDIDTGRLLARHDVAAARGLNDVAVAPGGRVYATDAMGGAVYEIAIKGPGPARAVVQPGGLRFPNGLAPSPDGRRLYVAHATGIAAVDVADGRLTPVANATRETVAAIDGLYQWQGQLIGVQNQTNPGRVIVASLSRDGTRITRVQTLLSHHHNAVSDPTTGAVGDGVFYLLATTGGSHWNPEGRVDDPQAAPKPLVLRIPLPR